MDAKVPLVLPIKETTINSIRKLPRWCIDASRTPNGTGIGIWKDGEPAGVSTSLESSPSTFHASIIAIQTCAEGISTSLHETRSVDILSDSQGVLRTLQVAKFGSDMVLSCHRKLKQLAEYYCGISGNELAGRTQLFGSQRSHCKGLIGMGQCKILGILSYQERLYKAVSMSRPNLRMVTGISTGYCTLNKHFHYMGLAKSPQCRRNCP